MAIVDVHSHFFPRGLGEYPSERLPRLEVDGTSGRIMIGDDRFRTVSAPLWDVAARLDVLAANDVEFQLISPVPVTLDLAVEFVDAAAYHRSMNEGIATSVAEAPDRLGGLAAVPTQDVGAAIAEMKHAVFDLGLVGVEIGATFAGRELDDEWLRPFFTAADEIGALVFVHPLGGGEGVIRRSGQPYDFGLGMLTDTAMAASALLFGGVLDACPNLKVLLAHGCGTFPWVFPRLSAGTALGGDTSSGDHVDLARRFWVDTLVFDPEHLGLLAHRFGADRILAGSDFPFIPGQLEGIRDLVSGAVGSGSVDASGGAGILASNARALLGLKGD